MRTREVRRGGARRVPHLLRLDREDDEIDAGDRRGVALRMNAGAGKARRQLVALRRIGSTTRSSAARAPRASMPPTRAGAMLPPPMKRVGDKAGFSALRAAKSRFASCRPRAEHRRADAHHRRAFGDRRLEVVRHPHRQRVERQPGRASGHRSNARRIRNCAASRRQHRRRLGNPHEAAQLQPRQRRPPRAPARAASSGGDAALRRLAADVDLHAHVERAAARPAAAPTGGRRSCSRSTPCTQSNRAARRASCCSAAGRSGAIRSSDRSASASILASASCT